MVFIWYNANALLVKGKKSQAKTIEITLWPNDWKTEHNNYLDDSILDVEKNETKVSIRQSTLEDQSVDNTLTNLNTQDENHNDIFEYNPVSETKENKGKAQLNLV